MKSARKVQARRRVRRSTALSLSARVERLEKTLLFPAPKIAIALASSAASEGPRFTKLGTDGKPTTDPHVAVHDRKTNLVWSAEPLQGGANLNHADALKACTQCDLLAAADWRAPTIEELLSIVDYTRYDPAVDPEFFKGPYGWTWSSTLYKGSAGYAWCVYLLYGRSYIFGQADQGRVRAVRSGQQLGLLG